MPQTLVNSIAETLKRTLGSAPNLKQTILPAPSSTSTPDTSGPGRVELLSLIGEGGMAQVHLARQNTLGRHVAVKMLRPDRRSEAMVHHLLQEAWTTGALEHPNIVPVHDITLSSEGAPQIVLKRIEGRSWSDLLSDPSRAPLEEQLRILMDVARAVEFAHRRGFLHRDLKPENVLVGELGDVYLADWGIAVCMSAADERFPLASDVQTIAGTPAYMAPEMLDPENTPLGPWTDIYLLGSILYELLAQRPPHEGESMAELVHNIVRGPEMPDCEAELVRICARAMQNDPTARFESALQFRLAVRGYLQHEGARAIAAKADSAFAAWHVHRRGGDMMAADDSFAKSRFGYQAALESWPDFEYAAARLRDLDLEMAQAELGAGNLESARRVVARVDDPPAELLNDLRAAEEALREAKRRRESLAAAANDETHRGTRAAISALLGAIFVFGPLFRSSFVEATPFGLIAPYLASLVLVVGVALLVRRKISQSYVNRALVTIVVAMMVTDLTLSLLAVRYHLGFLWLVQMLPVVWACGATISVGLISRRFWPTALTMTMLCFAVREQPRLVNELTAAATLILFLNAAWVNRGWSELQKRFGRTDAGLVVDGQK